MPRSRREKTYDEEKPKRRVKSPAGVETTVPPTVINGEVTNALLVKVRENPDKESKVVAFLRKGTHVNILEKMDGFHKIEIVGIEIPCYIMSEYIKEV